MAFFITNRDLIKDFSVNTGTSQNPVYTPICSTSEMTLTTDFNEKTWYDFCSAIENSIITGASVSLEGTVKVDINNTAIQTLIGKVDTLITAGTISQFNNQMIKFSLLTGVNNSVLEYSSYQCNANITLESLGGSAEDEGEFAITVKIIGTGTEVSA